MTTAVAQSETRLPRSIGDFLRIPDLGRRLASIAPPGYDGARLVRELGAALRENPTLRVVTVESMLISVSRVASLGLSLAPAHGEAHLIPRKNKNRPGEKDATLQVGRNGWVALALRCNQNIVECWSHAVYKRDKFKLALGGGFNVAHEPATGDRGELVSVYAIALFRSGGTRGVYMGKPDVMAARQMADADSPAWKNFEAMMWEKVALKRLARLLAAGHSIVTAALAADSGDTPDLPIIELPAVGWTDPEREKEAIAESIRDGRKTSTSGAAATSEETAANRGEKPEVAQQPSGTGSSAPSGAPTFDEVAKAIAEYNTGADRDLACDLLRSVSDSAQQAELAKKLTARDKELAAQRKAKA
jgi:phage RecT family recombinase